MSPLEETQVAKRIDAVKSKGGSSTNTDWQDLNRRIQSGITRSLPFVLLGALAAVSAILVFNRGCPSVISTRAVFSFPGFEHGIYPDKSNFQPDDLRSAQIIQESLNKLGLNQSPNFRQKLQQALSVQNIVPPQIILDRDHLRSLGQTAPLYTPDEYAITLSDVTNLGVGRHDQMRLLNEIVLTYLDNFRRTYGEMPVAFGHVLERLKAVDFPEYELILNTEVKALSEYLEERSAQAPTFRSPTTHLSFEDLLEQTHFFSEIQLNETLGLIHEYGLSQNRSMAMLKMDNQLRLLSNREKLAMDENDVIKDLLAQSQRQTENYIVGIKSQAVQARNDAPIMDQTLIDSLLTTDAYNFLVRRALKVGFEVKDLQAEKDKLSDLSSNMQSFVKGAPTDQSATIDEAKKSLAALEIAYQKLIDNIKKTYADFAIQEYGNAIRLTAPIAIRSLLKPSIIAGSIGALLGLALSLGLSLLGRSKCTEEKTNG